MKTSKSKKAVQTSRSRKGQPIVLRGVEAQGRVLIFKRVRTNPRRPGTRGWMSWKKVRDGMTYGTYIARGGRNRDLQWDLKHGFVELRVP